MGCSWHLHWAFSAILFFTTLGTCAESYSQYSDVQRGVDRQAIPQDSREEDAGFDDYNYRADYELRDRWWIEPETRRADPFDAAEPATPHAEVNRRDVFGREYHRTTWDEAADIVEPAPRISGDVYPIRRPDYDWDETFSDLQPVPDFGASFRWQGPTDRPNYILPPVPYLSESYPEAYRPGEIDLYRDGRFYDVVDGYDEEGPYDDDWYYDYYDYRNYYEVGGYSRDDEPGIGIYAR